MKSIVAAIAALALAVVSAQEQGIVYVTAPLTGATVTAGEPYTIRWQDASVDTITQIELRQGASTALQPVMTIASNVEGASGSYTWDVPADIAPGADYALVFGTNPFAYSGTFSIAGGSGASSSAAGSSSAAVPSSSAASSSAAPSSSPATSSSVAPSSSVGSSASRSASKTQSASQPAESDESAAVKSQPAALAALAIAGVAAVAMI